MTVREFVFHPWSSLDVDLKGHPFIGNVAEAVALRWEKCRWIRFPLRVETKGFVPSVLKFEIVRSVMFLKSIIRPVGAGAGTRIVDGWKAALIAVLYNNFEVRTRRIQMASFVASADDRLLPPSTVLESRVQKIRKSRENR
jgi:hypothetical protein